MKDLKQSLTSSIVRLSVFGLVTAALLGFSYEYTRERIIEQERIAALKIYDALIPADSYDNDLLASETELSNELSSVLNNSAPALVAKKNGQLQSVILRSDALDGYSGRISLILAIKHDGTLLGTRVVKHTETPGLGDAIEPRISDWIYSFNDRVYTSKDHHRWFVKKDGGEFDQFTGATVTPRAVVGQVRRTLAYLDEHPEWLEELQ